MQLSWGDLSLGWREGLLALILAVVVYMVWLLWRMRRIGRQEKAVPAVPRPPSRTWGTPCPRARRNGPPTRLAAPA
jgi:hypothetical protein